MSIKATLSSNGLEEVYTAPTLKEMCLYKCLTNKEILTTEVEVDEEMDGSEKLDWEKFRLKEPIQRDLVEALLDAGDNFLFALTPKYEPVLAAIRMTQPEHLVKVHVNNSVTLVDRQLELLISGGNVRSLDINSCLSLRRGSLDAINKFGSKLEYLRIGDCYRVLPEPDEFSQRLAILRTPNVKTFIVGEIHCFSSNVTNYWRCLLQDFISDLEDLQISRADLLETLEFLEPARNKLSSLTLRNSSVVENANAWACLFKLEKLRFLDVVGSSIEEALVGGDVVQRLLTVMPNLKSLVVDPGAIKDIYVHTSIRGQGSQAKRLEFLGIMDNHVNWTDETEVRKAKLLANDVAFIGTVEGELRVLEYFSNRLNASCFDSTLELLLKRLSDVAPWNTVAVMGLLMKTVKNNGVDVAFPSAFEYLKSLFIPHIWANLGEVLKDQFIGAVFTYMSRWSVEDPEDEPVLIRDVIDIMMNLGGGLRLDHYLTLVPMVMSVAERTITKSVLHEIGMEDFKNLLTKIAQLLENAADRFPTEINALWGISSVLVVTKQLKEVIVSAESDKFYLLEIFGSLITSLLKLCLNSGPRRAAFHSAEGVDIVMELLTEIIDGCLGLADRDSFALLEILQSILQDTNLNLAEAGMIASRLEKLLFSLHSKWEFWESNPVRETTHYNQFESIASLLNILENDPRHDYDSSAELKEIRMKLK